MNDFIESEFPPHPSRGPTTPRRPAPRYAGEGVTSGPEAGDRGPGVADLDARRRAHRQGLREASLHALVVLPHTEGELAAVLGHLEDLLLDDVDDDEPVVAADPEAVDAVGRLASYVGGLERGELAAQPVAPDGRYELVPLHTAAIGRKDLSRILGAIVGLPPASAEAMRSRFGGDQEAARFVAPPSAWPLCSASPGTTTSTSSTPAWA